MDPMMLSIGATVAFVWVVFGVFDALEEKPPSPSTASVERAPQEAALGLLSVIAPGFLAFMAGIATGHMWIAPPLWIALFVVAVFVYAAIEDWGEQRPDRRRRRRDRSRKMERGEW